MKACVRCHLSEAPNEPFLSLCRCHAIAVMPRDLKQVQSGALFEGFLGKRALIEGHHLISRV